MKLKNKSYIWRGAFGGLLVGHSIAGTYLSSQSHQEISYLADLSIQSFILVLACIVLGAWIGHILRH